MTKFKYLAYAIAAAAAVYLVRKLAYKATDVLARIALKRAKRHTDGEEANKKPMFG